MAADLKSEDLVESVVKGFKQYELTRVYQSIGPTGPASALNSAGLPPLGQPLHIPGGDTVWCYRRHPTRPDKETSKTKWFITCSFSNDTSNFGRDSNGNPTTTPDQQVKEVGITYEKLEEVVLDAELKKMQYEDGTTLTIPNWLNNYVGPICNSAKSPRQVTRSKSFKTFRVGKYLDTWPSSFDDFVDTINNDAITIEQTDSYGSKASYSCAAETLLMQDIIKHDIWRNGRLYFKAVFVMLYNKDTWTHIEIDSGTERLAVPSLTYNPHTNNEYTQTEVNEAAGVSNTNDADSAYVGITVVTPGGGEVAIGNPVLFNGNGTEVNLKNKVGTVDSRPVELHFDKYKDRKKAFGDLDL